MISDQDTVFQAQAFRSYTSAGGSAARWWRSKDFAPRDRRKIELEIKRQELFYHGRKGS